MTDPTKAEKPTDFHGAQLEGAKFSKPYPKAYTPSPDAIVRAALERAAQASKGEGESEFFNLTQAIRALAADPAEIEAIIKKAEEDRG